MDLEKSINCMRHTIVNVLLFFLSEHTESATSFVAETIEELPYTYAKF